MLVVIIFYANFKFFLKDSSQKSHQGTAVQMFCLRQRLHDEGKPETAPSDSQHYGCG